MRISATSGRRWALAASVVTLGAATVLPAAAASAETRHAGPATATSWEFSSVAGVPSTADAFVAGGTFAPKASDLVLFDNGTSVTQQTVPAPGHDADLVSVTATSTANAWAAGWDCTTKACAADAALLVRWNGTSWSKATLPAGSSYLDAVSAASTRDAWAAGSGTSGGLLLHWNGTAWTKASVKSLGADTYLTAVADHTKTDAWVGGGGATGALLAHWNGTAWTKTKATGTGTGSGVTSLSDVPGTDDAWALVEGSGQTLVLHWNGTKWAKTALPASVVDSYAYLDSVSASSSSDAWISGEQYRATKDTFLNLTLHWNGTKWAVVKAPNPGTADSLLGTSDVSATDAWAVGIQGYCGSSTGQMLHWNGTAWSSVATPTPSIGASARGTVKIRPEC